MEARLARADVPVGIGVEENILIEVHGEVQEGVYRARDVNDPDDPSWYFLVPKSQITEWVHNELS